MDVMGALQNKIGPLEAWQWGALAGGGILVYRLVTSGHQNTGAQTVTLTPNNQPDLSGTGRESVGGILSDFTQGGFAPSDFTITLPDGTTVHFTGGVISTTPPPGNGGGSGGGGGGGGSGGDGSKLEQFPRVIDDSGTSAPPLGSIVAAPMPRDTGVQVRPSLARTPAPTPRLGGVIVGAAPAPSPAYKPPASVVINPGTSRGTTPNPSVTPSPTTGGR
jgi:hypothetical protein